MPKQDEKDMKSCSRRGSELACGVATRMDSVGAEQGESVRDWEAETSRAGRECSSQLD